MKNTLITVIFFSAAVLVKAQCISIYASEKIKGVEIPIGQMEFEVYINDSLKKKGNSKSDGFLGRIYLGQGTYRIKIINPYFSEGIRQDVVVNDARTTSVQMTLIRSNIEAEGKKKR